MPINEGSDGVTIPLNKGTFTEKNGVRTDFCGIRTPTFMAAVSIGVGVVLNILNLGELSENKRLKLWFCVDDPSVSRLKYSGIAGGLLAVLRSGSTKFGGFIWPSSLDFSEENRHNKN